MYKHDYLVSKILKELHFFIVEHNFSSSVAFCVAFSVHTNVPGHLANVSFSSHVTV